MLTLDQAQAIVAGALTETRRASAKPLGPVGIGGDTADVVEQCALAGIVAAGLDRKDPA